MIVAGICTAAAADDRKKQSEDLLKQARAEQRALAQQIAGVSAADVGDPDSFGRNVHFIGVAQTGLVTVTVPGGCPTPDPNFPDDRCVEATPTASIDATDIGRIRLPAKASNSLLCHSLTSLPFWEFSNQTASPVTASFQYVAGVTIENEVLNDPTLIDPNTGLPFNGSLEVALGLITDRQTLQPGDRVTRRHSNTRSCIGGLVSKLALTEGFGLTAAQADAFFKKPMTLRLNISLRTAFVDNTFVLFGLRLFGD
ncbi:MAG: hypothetical protein DMF98_25600 [Acidobacteria bacterium]|nr:MAG: hypothetical protein DMF98_25600 [Acidobacteriota bacterium]